MKTCSHPPTSKHEIDRIEYRYIRLGEVVEITDQNGTVHGYEYDALRRLRHDKVMTVGTGLDDRIRRISREYEARRMLQTPTSLEAVDDESANVVNEVRLEYHAFSQPKAVYQSQAPIL